MAHETIDGKLCPQAYHDVYRLVCPNDENRVTESIFSKMTLESHLERDQLKAIWTACDVDKVGVLKKQHLFQALAFLALAQHGEEPALATLQGYPELPVPELGDMKSAASQTKLAGSVTMDFTYTELQNSEFIQVTIGKKKGALKKHTIYTIYSQRLNKTVERRYSDFEPLDSLLHKRFPYRIIPSLPPKAFGSKNSDAEFLEKRRKGLGRFLTFIARHPVLRDDEIVVYFLSSDEGGDFKDKLKGKFKGIVDEFRTNPIAKECETLVPQAYGAQLAHIKSAIDPLVSGFTALKAIVDKIAAQTTSMAAVWKSFGDTLRGVSESNCRYLAGADRWVDIQGSMKDFSNHLAAVTDRYSEQRVREEDGVCDNLLGFLDILNGLKDLLDRQGKGIGKQMSSTQRRLSADQAKLGKMQASSSADSDKASKLEGKIASGDSEMDRVINEHMFSLYCIWAESKLIRANFGQVGFLLQEMVMSQATGNKQLAGAWEALETVAVGLITKLDASVL